MLLPLCNHVRTAAITCTCRMSRWVTRNVAYASPLIPRSLGPASRICEKSSTRVEYQTTVTWRKASESMPNDDSILRRPKDPRLFVPFIRPKISLIIMSKNTSKLGSRQWPKMMFVFSNIDHERRDAADDKEPTSFRSVLEAAPMQENEPADAYSGRSTAKGRHRLPFQKKCVCGLLCS